MTALIGVLQVLDIVVGDRARYYDPGTGRFLQKDPEPGRINIPVTVVSWYVYVLNNPLNFADSSGKSIFDDLWNGIESIFKGLIYLASTAPSALETFVEYGFKISLSVALIGVGVGGAFLLGALDALIGPLGLPIGVGLGATFSSAVFRMIPGLWIEDPRTKKKWEDKFSCVGAGAGGVAATVGYFSGALVAV